MLDGWEDAQSGYAAYTQLTELIGCKIEPTWTAKPGSHVEFLGLLLALAVEVAGPYFVKVAAKRRMIFTPVWRWYVANWPV